MLAPKGLTYLALLPCPACASGYGRDFAFWRELL